MIIPQFTLEEGDQKMVELDFRDPFRRFDVISEIGMDPELMLDPPALNAWLDSQIEVDEPMNLKQKFDHLIE